MPRDLLLGQFVPVDSALHRLDPRTKILLALSYTILLFTAASAGDYLATTGFLFLAAGASRIPVRRHWQGLRPFSWLVLVTAALNLFLTPGDPWWRWGPLVASREGLSAAIELGLRLLLLIWAASLLTQTTSPLDLTDGLERLLRPGRALGLPAHELALMMTIALRFVPTLLEEGQRIARAQMARGASWSGGPLLQRGRGLLALLVPLFASALRRADELAVAMEARCYRGGEGRTRLRELRYRPGDGVAAAAALALALFLIWA